MLNTKKHYNCLTGIIGKTGIILVTLTLLFACNEDNKFEPGIEDKVSFEEFSKLKQMAASDPANALKTTTARQEELDTVGSNRDFAWLNIIIAESEIQTGQSKKAIEKLDSAIETGHELNDNKLLLYALVTKATAKRNMGELEEASQLFSDTIKIASESNTNDVLALAANRQATVQAMLGKMVKSLQNFQLAEEAFRLLGNEIDRMRVVANLGILHGMMRNFEKALEVNKEILPWMEGKKDIRGIVTTLVNRSSLNIELGNLPNAISAGERAVQLATESKLQRMHGEAQLALAKAYVLSGRADDSYQAAKVALQLGQELGLPSLEGGALVSMAASRIEGTPKSLERALTGTGILQNIEDNYAQIEGLRIASELQEEFGDFESALATHKQYLSLQEKIVGEESTLATSRLQAEYGAKERERTISYLKEQQQVSALELSRERDLRIMLLVGLFFVIIISGLLVNRTRLRAAQQIMIETVKHEKQKSEHLQEVDHLKDEFLANISHELRTPLYGMTGLIEAMLYGPSKVSSETHKLLTIVLQSGQRLSKLVGDILDFSKLQHQGLELSLEPVELSSLVDVVLTLSKPVISGSTIELVNAIEQGCPHVLADEARIEQVLHNLVGNAIKFTEQGKIVVSAQRQGDELLVQVSDTGIGIAPAQQEKIFEFFVQADNSTQRVYGGTGLGLAVSKQLVELHDGHIKVESIPGKGSTFSFTLQIAEAVAGEEAAKNTVYERRPAPDVVEQGNIILSESLHEVVDVEKDATVDLATILIVDDEQVVHKILKLHLASKGYHLLSASSGPQALTILESNDVDLVLLDIMMPRMTGYEVCRTIRETNSREELPVIFLSAKDRSRDRVASFDEGGNDYLIKPISRNELLVRIDTQLELLHERQTIQSLNEDLETQVAERTQELNAAKVQAEELARTDVLSGMNNRRAFFEYSDLIHTQAVRYNHPYSILMLDIDHFKKINDTHGHNIGDLAIKATADTISSILRAVDVSGRIGGEEFAIILPQTQVVHAETIANRLRNLVSQITVPANGTEVAFTVSIGVTKNHDREASINDVLERADTALYEAKTQGRNKVIVG